MENQRDLIARAVALGVKLERAGIYPGFYAVADLILNDAPIAIEHKMAISKIESQTAKLISG